MKIHNANQAQNHTSILKRLLTKDSPKYDTILQAIADGFFLVIHMSLTVNCINASFQVIFLGQHFVTNFKTTITVLKKANFSIAVVHRITQTQLGEM